MLLSQSQVGRNQLGHRQPKHHCQPFDLIDIPRTPHPTTARYLFSSKLCMQYSPADTMFSPIKQTFTNLKEQKSHKVFCWTKN